MSYNTGDRVGDYEVVDILGAGGMGRVYKVRNVISERIEAMKVLLPNLESDRDLADRFMREIKVQASLQHPNIACLHTALRVNNQLLMLIEYVEGSTVEEQLRNGPLPVQTAVRYVQQVLLALGYAHQHGVVHRDIKPANIMVVPDGTVKLMDFGIARLNADRKLTQTGSTVGSLYYMSPEQIQGAANLDARTDLYSLGVTLYEMVTARRPFQGDSDYSIMAAHLSARPMAPVEIDPSLPPALNDAILMSIAKDPAQRFQTADAFRSALNSVLAERLQAVAGSAPAPATRIVSTPPPPVAQPGPPPPVVSAGPSTAEPKGRRGLYMAIGSVATVLVLAVVALQAPKLFDGSEAAGTAQEQNTPAPVAQQPETQVPAPQPSLYAPAPVAAPAAAPAQTPNTARQEVAPRQTVQAPNVAAQVPSSTQPAPLPEQAAPSLTRESEAAEQTEPAPAQVAAQRQPAAPDMSDFRERLMLLGTRVNSLKDSLNSIRQQQSRQGLNLRQDIATAEQRTEFYLDEAASAVKAADPARAKKSLDSAERAVETIEKFLGR